MGKASKTVEIVIILKHCEEIKTCSEKASLYFIIKRWVKTSVRECFPPWGFSWFTKLLFLIQLPSLEFA